MGIATLFYADISNLPGSPLARAKQSELHRSEAVAHARAVLQTYRLASDLTVDAKKDIDWTLVGQSLWWCTPCWSYR